MLVVGLALKDNAFRDDDSGTSVGGQVFGYIVYKQDFAAIGLDGKAVVGADAAAGRHEGRVGQDNVGVFVPAFFAGQGVVFVDMRLPKPVEIHVHPGEAHHVGGDVVAFEVVDQSAAFVGSQRALTVVVRVGRQDVVVCGYEEAGGAAGRVQHGLVFLRVYDSDDEVDDMAGSAELAGIALGTEDGKQVFKGVAQAFRVFVSEFVDDFQDGEQVFKSVVRPFRVVVGELVDSFEERPQGLRVVVG